MFHVQKCKLDPSFTSSEHPSLEIADKKENSLLQILMFWVFFLFSSTESEHHYEFFPKEKGINSLASALWNIYVSSVALTFLWSPKRDQIFKGRYAPFYKPNELETLSYTGTLKGFLGEATRLWTITCEEAEFRPLPTPWHFWWTKLTTDS